jgi:hypothetical protein
LPDFEPKHWEIGKLELRPGQILIVRYTPDPSVNERHTAMVVERAAKAFRGVLDAVGLKEKVPVLVITDQFDINAICPLEFMDICVQAKQQEK